VTPPDDVGGPPVGQAGTTLKLLGKATKNVSANELMWEFFDKHPMK
jgi:poly(3-hydroxybutyrate) depolymerase